MPGGQPGATEHRSGNDVLDAVQLIEDLAHVANAWKYHPQTAELEQPFW